MKKLLLSFFLMACVAGIGFSQATIPSSYTIRVEEAVTPSTPACGDVTDCAAGIICWDVYFEIDEADWDLYSYDIWMGYGTDNSILSYSSDLSCHHIDGGDINLDQFGRYRFLAANAGLELSPNVEVKIHNFCVDIIDAASVLGLDVTAGGPQFNLASNFNIVDRNNSNNAYTNTIAPVVLTMDPSTFSCFIVAVDDATVTPEDVPVTIDVPMNDMGPYDVTTVTELDPPLNGTNVVNPDGTITYTPDMNFVGFDSFTYVICDPVGTLGYCDTATVVIEIEDGNNPPVLLDEITTTPEETPIEICLTVTDVDVADMHAISALDLSCGPNNGVVDDPIAGDLCLTYTPDDGFNGIDSFCVIVCDDGVPIMCDTNVVIIDVLPVNDAPIAVDDATVTDEDMDVTIPAPGILDNDSDEDGDPLDLNTTPITDAMNGTVTINPDGSITYSPDMDFNGVDSFTYEICDVTPVAPQPLCDTATVVITVNPVNDPPVVPDEMTTTPEDTPVEVCVDPTDVDAGDIVTITGLDLSCGPNNGTVTDPNTADLCMTYTPDPNFNGMDTFCVIVCDDGMPVLCDTSMVIVTVSPVNDAPVAVDDVTSTDEDMPVTVPTPGVGVNDTDPDMDPLTVTPAPVVDPVNGSVSLNPDGSFTYTPDMNFNGVDSFTYEICDVTVVEPQPLCDEATVVITVNPVNDPPVVPDEMTTTPEDVPVEVCLDPTDVDLDNMVVTGLDPNCGPSNGTVSDPNTADFCLTYTPANDFNGMDTFCVIICDDGMPVLCDTAMIIVTVDPVNDAPIAMDDMTTTLEGDPVTVPAPGVTDNDTDPDGDPLAVTTTPVVDPMNGTVSLNSDGSFTYTPDPLFNGTDSFTYEVCDVTLVNPQPLCDEATVVITVISENDPPVVLDEMTVTPEETPVEICLTATDPDMDPLTVTTTVCGPNNGTITPGSTPFCFIYTPEVDFPSGGVSEFDTICFVVCDNGTPMLCDTNQTIIEVTPVNDAPIAYPDTFYTPEDTPVSFDVGNEIIDNDVDPDGDLVESTLSLVQDVMNGSLTLNGLTGVMTYTPDPNFNGVDSFIYEICDDGVPSLCADTTVYIFISPVNDPPVANQDFTTTDEDVPVSINVVLNDNDDLDNAEVDPTSVMVIIPPANGTILSIDPVTGVVTYVPDPGWSGLDVFHYVVCDTGVGPPVPLCDTTQVFVNVIDVNDAPIAVDDMSTTPEDTPVTVDVLDNDYDTDGILDPSTVAIIDAPENGVIDGIDPTTGQVIYTPDPNFVGLDSFDYVICDDGIPAPVLCDTATVYITVEATNDPPVVPDEMSTTDEDTPIEVCVSPTDLDIPADVLTIAGLDPNCGPSNGTVTDPNPGDFCMTYTPDENFNGMDTFCVIVCDDGTPILCDTATVIITVNPVNDPPIAIDDISIVDENLPLVINVDGNDTDVDGMVVPTTVDEVTAPMNGTITINPDGTITYQPDPNFIGVDSFDYVICDDGNPNPVLCDTATVILDIIERCTEVNVRVYLEGSYLGSGAMRTDINDNYLLPGMDLTQHPFHPIPSLIGESTPQGQPYNRTPWNYPGNEGDAYGDPTLYPGAAAYPADVVDWVLLSLRANDSLATSVIWRCAALVTELGFVEIPADCECLNTLPQDKYYFVVEHRNHLPVMSEVIFEENDPGELSFPELTFDFTIQNSWVFKIGTFEFGVGEKEIEPGIFAMFAGNGQQENGSFDRRDVNSGDNNKWFQETGDTYHYVDGDFDMNVDVNSGDNTLWFTNAGTTNTQIPLNVAD